MFFLLGKEVKFNLNTLTDRKAWRKPKEFDFLLLFCPNTWKRSQKLTEKRFKSLKENKTTPFTIKKVKPTKL